MLIKNLFSNTIFTFIKLILAFLVNIIISRLLFDPSIYGIFSLSISYIGILIVILGLGINGSLVRFSTEELAKKNLISFISECYSNVFAIQFLFILISFSFSSYLSDLIFNSPNYQFLIYFIGFCLIIETISLWISSVFWGLNNFKLRGLSISIIPFFKFIFLGVTYFFLKKASIQLIILLILLSEIFSLSLLLFFFKKKFGSIPFKLFQLPAFNSEKVRKSFSFGMWSMLAAIGMLLMGLIDKIFINEFINKEILGKYTILSSLISYLPLLVVIVSNVLLSNYLKIWEKNQQIVINKINQVFYILLILLIIGSILMNYCSDFIISNLYGNIYVGLAHLIPIMLLSVFYNSNYMIIGNLAAISKNPKFTTYSFLIGLSVNVIGNFFFTPIFGLNAIVITTAVSYFFIAVSMSLFIKFHIRGFSLKPLISTIVVSILIYYVC